MTTKDSRIRQKIQSHPAVYEVYYEGENGWWIHLREGWIDGEAHTTILREDTLKELHLRLLKYVKPGQPQ